MPQYEYKIVRHYGGHGEDYSYQEQLGDLLRTLNEYGADGWLLVGERGSALIFARAIAPPPTAATKLTSQVKQGDQVSTTFTVDTVDGVANLQFTDDHGDKTAGPNDSVTGSPLVPVVVSDNSGVLTVAAASPGADAGSFSAALTPVVEGVANLSVAALVNSDGSPAVDAAGNPFSLPASVEVTVSAGPAAALTLTVTG